METGRKANKVITANAGTGLSNSATPNNKVVMPLEVRTSTSGNMQYAGEDDSSTVLTGVGGGEYAGNGGTTPHRWGHTAPSGSRVEINDSGGSERIEMVHHSGAAVSIDPDGSVYVTSTSRRGGGAAAPYGDYYISAGGDVVIRGGGSLTIDTPGNLNLNVGGILTISAGSYNLITKNMDETIDGSASRSVTNDQSQVVGGINRLTVAGDMREQITGKKILDVSGAYNTRVDGDNTYDVGGKNNVKIGGESSTSVGGTHSIASGGTSTVSSEADNIITAGGKANLTGSGETTVFSGGAVKLTGSEINATPKVDRAQWSDWAGESNLAVALGGSSHVQPPANGGGAGSAASKSAPAEAQTMEANDIVDNLTSARKYPEYPGNGVREAASQTGLGMISHDTSPQAEDVYNEYSGQNTGNVNPATPGETVDSLPDTPVDRPSNLKAQDPGISVPARHNNSAKISKYFTLGQLVNKSNAIPDNMWESVVKNFILVATNVLDPIKEKFPSIEITSAWRPAESSSNHVTGRAIDLVNHDRSMMVHAEIARFARDSLPIDQVFLERNDSGRTHVHVRVSESGTATSNPKVMTCADKKCRMNIKAIDVQYLKRKGAK